MAPAHDRVGCGSEVHVLVFDARQPAGQFCQAVAGEATGHPFVLPVEPEEPLSREGAPQVVGGDDHLERPGDLGMQLRGPLLPLLDGEPRGAEIDDLQRVGDRELFRRRTGG